MRKFLSMALVLIMVLTMVSAMTVTVIAEEPTTGEVIVSQLTFDSNIDGVGAMLGGKVTHAVLDGEGCLKLEIGVAASDLIVLTNTEAQRLGSDIWQGGWDVSFASDLVPIINGKNYFHRFSAIASKNVNQNFNQAITEGTIATVWPNVSKDGYAEVKDGWTAFKSDTFTSADPGKTARRYYQKTYLYEVVLDALVATGTYCGTGFKGKTMDGTVISTLDQYKFTGLDGKEYHLADDCSANKVAGKDNAAILQAYLDELEVYYYMDDYQLVTNGTFYTNDTVTVGNGGSVTISTSAVDSVTVNAGETKTITVNDCCNVKFTANTDDGVMAVATVDGVTTAFTNNVFTLAYDKAAEANEIKISFTKGDSKRTRKYTKSLEGTATASAANVTSGTMVSPDGKLTLTIDKSASATIVGKGNAAPYLQWNDMGTGRIRFTVSDFYWATERQYKIIFDAENPGTTATKGAEYVQFNKFTGNSFATGATVPGEYVNGAQWGPSISFSTVPAETRAESVGNISIDYISPAYGNSVTGDNKNIGLYNKSSFETVGQAAQNGLAMRYYGLSIEETVSYHPIMVNSGEGSVTATTKSLNFAADDVIDQTFENGEYIDVEHDMGVTFSINAPDGKVPGEVVYRDSTGKETVLLSNGSIYKIPTITLGGSIDISYIDDPAAIQSTYEYITLSANNTLLLNGATLSGARPIVIAYDEEGKAYDVSASEFVTITSDNSQVIKVEDNKLSTTENFGFATITATYDNLEGEDISATVMYQRSEYENMHVIHGYAANHKATDGMISHYGDAVVYKIKNGVDGYNYAIRAYSGDTAIDYNVSPVRTTSGWFYDDMSAGCYGYYLSFVKSNAGGVEFTHSESFGLIHADDTTYGTSAETGKVNTVPRSKGWHQVLTTITDDGYRVAYVDGICVYKAAIDEGIVPGDGASRLELRAQGNAYFSDFAVTDYVGTKENYTVTLDATNGTIEGSATVAHGTTAEYTLTANEGYGAPAEVTVFDYAGLNTQTIPVTGGKFSLTPSDNTIIKAVFTEKVATVPVVKSNSAADSGALNKTITGVDGNPVAISAASSVTAYATVDAGFGYTVGEYGIELKKGDKVVALKAVGSEYEGSYAITAFGAAIIAGDYSVRAYVKYTDADGASQVVYGDWATVVLN